MLHDVWRQRAFALEDFAQIFSEYAIEGDEREALNFGRARPGPPYGGCSVR